MMNTWYAHTGFLDTLFPFMFPFALPFFVVLALWSVGIKGYALWHAARNGQKWWFVFLLIVNGLGIPELVYLVWFRADRSRATTVAPAPAPAPATPDASKEA